MMNKSRIRYKMWDLFAPIETGGVLRSQDMEVKIHSVDLC